MASTANYGTGWLIEQDLGGSPEEQQREFLARLWRQRQQQTGSPYGRTYNQNYGQLMSPAGQTFGVDAYQQRLQQMQGQRPSWAGPAAPPAIAPGAQGYADNPGITVPQELSEALIQHQVAGQANPLQQVMMREYLNRAYGLGGGGGAQPGLNMATGFQMPMQQATTGGT